MTGHPTGAGRPADAGRAADAGRPRRGPADLRPARRARVSAALAPVGMIGGWTVAAALQPASFDPARDTISALATSAAAHGWVMTAGLAVTGVCHVVTASGLRAAAPGGRLLLAVGGVATAAVAALPVDVAPRAHGLAAGVGFVALAVWPAASWRRGRRGVLGRPGATAASVVLVALLLWFLGELQAWGPSTGDRTGASERVLAGAQSLWPWVVVAACARGARRAA